MVGGEGPWGPHEMKTSPATRTRPAFSVVDFRQGQRGSRTRTEDGEGRVSHHRKRTEKERPEGREEDGDATEGRLSTETGQAWLSKVKMSTSKLNSRQA